MSILCKEIKLLFIEMPRTGCTSIIQHLFTHHQGEMVHVKHASLKDTLDSVHEKYGYEPSDLYKVIGVRNPFDSTVSRYHKTRDVYGKDDKYKSFANKDVRNFSRKCHLEQWSFEEWMSKIGPINVPSDDYCISAMRRAIYNPIFMNEITSGMFDELIYFENLNENFSKVIERVTGSPAKRLDFINITLKENPLGDYREYYTESIRHMMENAFSKFMSYTGYRFGGNIRSIKM